MCIRDRSLLPEPEQPASDMAMAPARIKDNTFAFFLIIQILLRNKIHNTDCTTKIPPRQQYITLNFIKFNALKQNPGRSPWSLMPGRVKGAEKRKAHPWAHAFLCL